VPERIWLQSDAPGVPAQVDTSAWASLRQLVDGAVARYGPRPAFTNMGATLDFTAVDRLARDFAGALQHDLGLRRGDRRAIMLPNLLQYPMVLFAAFLAGLTVANVNPQYTPCERTARRRRRGLRTRAAGDARLLELARGHGTGLRALGLAAHRRHRHDGSDRHGRRRLGRSDAVARRAQRPGPRCRRGERALPRTAHGLHMVVEFRASLPKTPIGKVLKRELREPSVGAPTTDAVP
jgi:acyl-CoA synthetase (AMP-forming)/AMP-acid ligase II